MASCLVPFLAVGDILKKKRLAAGDKRGASPAGGGGDIFLPGGIFWSFSCWSERFLWEAFLLRGSRPGAAGQLQRSVFWLRGQAATGRSKLQQGRGVLSLLWRRGFEAVWRLLEEQLLEGGCRAERGPEKKQ